MVNDFNNLLADIEAEAAAEGPEAVAKLRRYQSRFHLASRIIGLRREHGWTQTKLAAESGVRQSELSDIELGKVSPNEDTLTKIGHAFGYRLDFVPEPAAERELVTA